MTAACGDSALTAEEKAEAKENSKAARVWFSGLRAVAGKLGVKAIYDLSATPSFLSGSGYREGTLFPWVVSDFALVEAIESGHRQDPAGARGRQRGLGGREVPEPVAEHRRSAAEAEPQGRGRAAEPARPAGDRADRPVRLVREGVPAVGGLAGGEGRRAAAGLHRRVQQHDRVEDGLRLHRGLEEARPARRASRAGAGQAGPVLQRPRRAVARPARARSWSTPCSWNPARRCRRSSGRSQPPRSRSSPPSTCAGSPAGRPTTSTTPRSCAR